ncbi:MAG TPA: hypothetical protein VNA25_27110 [Phycisphaerae bacterium]|nr:hypothetical protein [Phycisphaerae bacterium]
MRWLKIVGGAFIGQNPYDRINNPHGWRAHQFVTAEGVEKRIEKLITYMVKQTEATEENTRVTLALYHLMREATEADPLDGPTITTVGSADELV